MSPASSLRPQVRRFHSPARTSYTPASWRHSGRSQTCKKKRHLCDVGKKPERWPTVALFPVTFQLVVSPREESTWSGIWGRPYAVVRTRPFFLYAVQLIGAPPAHALDLNFGAARAYDLLIMNLNPLFWVNELKEIGQRMKATGPINSILWCITLPHHSSRPLRAFLSLSPLLFINYSERGQGSRG